jgi:hypothetical protein
MYIISGRAKVLQKGLVYDRVEVEVYRGTSSGGSIGPPYDIVTNYYRVPVQHDEIIARLKLKGKLSADVDESNDPLISTIGLDVMRLRKWIQRSLCKHCGYGRD